MVRRLVPVLAALCPGLAQAALVASMHVSPPGPLVQGQVVTITYTISNTGDSPVSVTIPTSGPSTPAFPSASPSNAFTFQNFTSGSGTYSEFTNPATLAAGGSYTIRWFARADLPGTATASFTVASTPASAQVTMLTSGAMFAKGPKNGFIEVRNNILRLEHRATMVVLVHGPAGGTVDLNFVTPSGAVLLDMAKLTLDGTGRGTFQFDGHGMGGSVGRPISTGLYWVVASGDVWDRKPVLVVDYSDRPGAKDAY